jgi:hypothetical protein
MPDESSQVIPRATVSAAGGSMTDHATVASAAMCSAVMNDARTQSNRGRINR